MEKSQMPTRRDEDWRAFCWSRFNLDNYTGAKKASGEIKNLPKRVGFDSLVFVDGKYSKELSDRIEAVFIESGVGSFSLQVLAGVELERPIQLLQVTTAASEGTQTLFACTVALQAGAKASIWFENWSAEKTEHVLIDQKNTIELEENAICNMVTCQRESGVQRLVQSNYIQANSSCLEWFYLGLDTDWTREQACVELQGEQTKTRLRGLLFPTQRQYMALHTLLKHEKPNTQAKQMFRCVAGDKGIAQLQGRVLVQPGADKTYSTQSSKSILLDPGAEARSCPQLEIYADDVVCNHGASIGELEKKQLFYLQSRGLDADTAKRILLRGFAQAVVGRVKEDVLKAELMQALEYYWEGTNS